MIGSLPAALDAAYARLRARLLLKFADDGEHPSQGLALRTLEELKEHASADPASLELAPNRGDGPPAEPG